MNPKMIIKAIKIKIAMNRLSRAKENAIRIHRGLSPIRPWYQECYIAVMKSVRKRICEIFTPCCVYKINPRIKRILPVAPCQRLFTSGTYDNEVFKHFLGFFAGALFAIMVYIILVFKLDYQPMTALWICAPLGFVVTIGMAFFHGIRCVILLILPQLFSSTGRSFLLLYVMILVLNNPVRNFNHNIMIMSESSTCAQQMAYNQTKDLVEAAAAPLASVIGSIRMVMKTLGNFAQVLRHSFTVLKTAVIQIAATIGRVLSWLKSIVTVCNNKMGQPYRKCVKAFNDAERDCRDALGWFLGWICGIVSAVKSVCHIAKIGELLCVIASAIKDLVASKLAEPVATAIAGVYEMFYFNVSIHYSYKFNMTQSKNFSQVKDDIMKEVKERISGFLYTVDIIQFIMMFSLVFVVIKAITYRWNYLTNDKFDNIYMTLNVQNIDERRVAIGRESILPLSWKESGKYIKALSLTLATKERSKLIKGLIRLLISFSYSGFYMMCDYGLYWLLDMLRVQLEVKTHAAVPPHLKIHVQGEGAIADMYRALIGFFDPLTEGVNIDTTPCLPNPSPPNYGVYRDIYTIFGICFLMTLFDSYGLRLRHIIASCYYPRRERERAVWLYNHILKTRGGFLKFSRRQMRRKYLGEREVEKSSIRAKLAAKYPIAEKIFKYFGWDRKACLSCGKEGRMEDLDNFQHCANAGCKAVFCMECYDDLNNLCTICMNPVDYNDFSDVSEERDSSDDEEEIARLKEMSKARREDIRRRREERTPGMILGLLHGHLGLTESGIEQEARRQALESYDSDVTTSTDYQYTDKLSSDPYSAEWSQWEDGTSKQKKDTKTVDLVSTNIFDTDSDSFDEYQYDDLSYDSLQEPNDQEMDRFMADDNTRIKSL